MVIFYVGLFDNNVAALFAGAPGMINPQLISVFYNYIEQRVNVVSSKVNESICLHQFAIECRNLSSTESAAKCI